MTLDTASSTLFKEIVRRNPAEPEFHQAVFEVARHHPAGIAARP